MLVLLSPLPARPKGHPLPEHGCGEDLTQFACTYSGTDLISNLIEFSHLLGHILKVHAKLISDPGD